MRRWIGLLAGIAGLIAFMLAGKPVQRTDAELVRFDYAVNGMTPVSQYTYEQNADGSEAKIVVYDYSCSDKTFTVDVDESFGQELRAIIERHDLWKWDGYSRRNRFALDGESFGLSIGFADETSIEASGHMNYPDGYAGAMAEIKHLFMKWIEASVPDETSPIAYFAYHSRGMSTLDIYSYAVETDGTTGEMSVSYDLYCGYAAYTLPADDELMGNLAGIIDGYNLRKWDGFDRTDLLVQDGSGFDLEVRFEDGTGISASGSNCFPTGHNEAEKAIDELFLGLLKKHGIDPKGGF